MSVSQKNTSSTSDTSKEALMNSLLWDMLPPELEGYFEVSGHKKTETLFRIWLTEINTIPENLPEKYHGKRIINTYTREITIEDFPLRGRKWELVLKRRFWKFEWVDELLHREIDIVFSGTKTDKEFADFLKEVHRQASARNEYSRWV
jgi:hypothetical protein